LSLKFAAPSPKAVPIHFVDKENWDAVRKALPSPAAAFALACGFEPKPGRCLTLPDSKGGICAALFGVESDLTKRDSMAAGRLVGLLPPGVYRFVDAPEASLAALSFLLGSYRFTRYREATKSAPSLVAPEGVDAGRLERIAKAVAFGRDLVNTPANDLGPGALEKEAVQRIGRDHPRR
jgi:leucyl aminopeptidase